MGGNRPPTALLCGRHLPSSFVDNCRQFTINMYIVLCCLSNKHSLPTAPPEYYSSFTMGQRRIFITPASDAVKNTLKSHMFFLVLQPRYIIKFRVANSKNEISLLSICAFLALFVNLSAIQAVIEHHRLCWAGIQIQTYNVSFH